MKLLGQHCKNNANLLNNIVQKHTRNVNLPHIVQKNNFRFFGSAQVVPIQRRFGDHLSMALCNTFNKLHAYEDEQLLVCADLKPNAYKYTSFYLQGHRVPCKPSDKTFVSFQTTGEDAPYVLEVHSLLQVETEKGSHCQLFLRGKLYNFEDSDFTGAQPLKPVARDDEDNWDVNLKLVP